VEFIDLVHDPSERAFRSAIRETDMSRTFMISTRSSPMNHDLCAARVVEPGLALRMAQLACILLLGAVMSPALAQTPPANAPDASVSPPAPAVPDAPAAAPAAAPTAATPAAPVAPPSDLQPFAWLRGCWEGKVNGREFREEWLPLRGDIMVGLSQTVMQGKTQDFEYVRLESRPDGVFYINVPSGKKETAFRFAGKTQDGARDVFTFENPVDEFPQRVIYRRGTEGWLYTSAEGQLNGTARSVIYPMRRVDCASGEFIRQ
jgi:Domain of unknown function (DUF6265)